MHPFVFAEFERICSARKAGEKILEIGAIPSDFSLLNMKSLQQAKEKIGINLDGPYTYKDFHIVQGNANSMTCFEDNKFDTVLCNATLEHDKFFWKTIAEIKRVTQKGGLVVISVPGFMEYSMEKYINYFLSKFRRLPLLGRGMESICESTITFKVHDHPGDYYRFSDQTLKEVFFEGMKEVKIKSIMRPPRIIGHGIKP